MASLLAAFMVLLLAQVASSRPAISFPFNAQLPQAARIDKFFSYSFSPTTFTSDSNITYSLGKHPDWLSIESNTRRLYGTPKDSDVSPGDVVGQQVDIIATDGNGPTTMSATIVISRNPPPSVQIPVSKQIGGFGNFSAPSSILSYPSIHFKYSFDSNTFGQQDLNYYATSGNGSPLPAWVMFDSASLTFSGKTPPFESLIQSPQTFNFSLVASDIVGFSASSLSFSIVVGSHKLTTDNPIIALNASRGSELTYNALENGIQLDGKQVAAGDLAVTMAGLPDWLSYDSKTRKLQGTPRPSDHSQNFTISFHDPFSDTLDVLAIVTVASSLFQSTLDDMEIRPGSNFYLDLAKYFRNPGDVQVKVTTSPDEEWLKVNGLELSGQVPKSAKGGFKISIDAASKSSDLKETEVLGVSFLALDGTTTTATVSMSSPTSTVTQTQTNSAASDSAESQSGHLSTGEILLATIIPILFITVLLLLLVCFFRRRRARRTYLSSKYRTKISNPVAGSLRANDSHPSMRAIEAMGGIVRTETQIFKPGKVGYAEVASQSSRRRSSETLGEISDPGMPQALLADEAGTATVRSVSNTESNDGRRSWVTVEGEGATAAARSEESTRSHRSDTTFPGSIHQILPPPGFLSDARNGDFRSGLDMTIPTIEDLPSIQAMPIIAYKAPKHSRSCQSLGAHSTTTSSSAALPPMFESNLRVNVPGDASVPNWETIAESEAGESMAPLRKPERALLLSRTEDSKQWYDVESSNGSKSVATEVSFASSENWRVISQIRGPRGPSPSYKDLVDEAPFNPSRPGTSRDEALFNPSRPWEHNSAAEPLPRSEWGDDVHSTTARLGPSVNVVSKPSDDGDEVDMSGGMGEPGPAPPIWGKEHSGHKVSEGSGSFTVFL
ncbi:Axial budding pattern protein 2 [Tolypocladium ophioglossoides CBS 100239]|uniref:Axial budding pattern protein 2 n=1 Tax=Tolypocladium ophioglossoides (strain CBS 100239) TaxID=1163406 RepID=A0A0L0MX24_TOLOC|nr:Axial budding pattern protein 2 [Tolypocladium ophioglossoides CBS 100239]